MPPVAPGLTDEPARTDPIIRGLSEAIGGPLGDHAVRRGGRPMRFWTPARIVLALVCIVLALHWVQKAPCRDGAWTHLNQYKYFCYTDVLALYYSEGLSDGDVPYRDHPVEYPVLTGAFIGALGLPVHAYGEGRSDVNQGQIFYDLNAFALGVFAVATAAALLALRRRRPWDAAMFAVAPALLMSASVNWDMIAVAFATFAILAWAKRRPVLAGVMIGLGTSAKFYPLLLLAPLVLLALRSGRWRGAVTAAWTTALTWVAINGPVAFLWWDNWRRFYSFSTDRGIDWGTFWYIGEHLPTGGGHYGLSWFSRLNTEIGHDRLNALYLGMFVLACIGIAAVTLLAPRRPRLAQLAFLVVAAFLLTGKVWSQQYILWLVPLVLLARPRWGAYVGWQSAELAYFFAFYGELMGASGRNVFPEWVFILASILRYVTVAILVGYVVRDIMRPEEDVVRLQYDDDPDGGEFDGAPDSPLAHLARTRFASPSPATSPATSPVTEEKALATTS